MNNGDNQAGTQGISFRGVARPSNSCRGLAQARCRYSGPLARAAEGSPLSKQCRSPRSFSPVGRKLNVAFCCSCKKSHLGLLLDVGFDRQCCKQRYAGLDQLHSKLEQLQAGVPSERQPQLGHGGMQDCSAQLTALTRVGVVPVGVHATWEENAL